MQRPSGSGVVMVMGIIIGVLSTLLLGVLLLFGWYHWKQVHSKAGPWVPGRSAELAGRGADPNNVPVPEGAARGVADS